MNLYELSRGYQLIAEAMEKEADENYYHEILCSIEDQFEKKAESYAKIILNLEADIEALNAEEKRLSEKRKAKQNAVTRLKEALHDEMIATGKTSFDNGLFSFRVAKNGGKPPIRLKVEEDKIPDEYKIFKPRLNMEALRALAEAGENEYCYIGEAGTHLRIR